jgi:MFS transporter, FSR family, fosmidomycin resistance protein
MRTIGRGFGFVSTGVSAGGVLAPVLFGWIIDQGHPGWVFGLLDIFTVIGLITVLFPGGSLTV